MDLPRINCQGIFYIETFPRGMLGFWKGLQGRFKVMRIRLPRMSRSNIHREIALEAKALAIRQTDVRKFGEKVPARLRHIELDRMGCSVFASSRM